MVASWDPTGDGYLHLLQEAKETKVISILRSKQKHLVQTSGEVEDAESKKASRSPAIQLNYPVRKVDNLDLTLKVRMCGFDFFVMKGFKFPP